MADKYMDCWLEDDLMGKIMEQRRAQDITQTAIAHTLGCTNAAVCRWEAGIAYPHSFNLWMKLARTVGANLVIQLEEK